MIIVIDRLVSAACDPRRRRRRRHLDDRLVVIAIILIFIFNFVLSYILFRKTRAAAETARSTPGSTTSAFASGAKVVMQNLSLDIVEGAITCIIGLSGAGKSTILRLLNGLRRPDEGRVLVRARISRRCTSAN